MYGTCMYSHDSMLYACVLALLFSTTVAVIHQVSTHPVEAVVLHIIMYLFHICHRSSIISIIAAILNGSTTAAPCVGYPHPTFPATRRPSTCFLSGSRI
ncbi:hypothetical protein J3E69DRAFT_61748 [Trichoderma sp. SZMC 28015]